MQRLRAKESIDRSRERGRGREREGRKGKREREAHGTKFVASVGGERENRERRQK